MVHSDSSLKFRLFSGPEDYETYAGTAWPHFFCRIYKQDAARAG